MVVDINFHDVAAVQIEQSREFNQGQESQFSARSIRITFADGTEQVIGLYSQNQTTVKLEIE